MVLKSLRSGLDSLRASFRRQMSLVRIAIWFFGWLAASVSTVSMFELRAERIAQDRVQGASPRLSALTGSLLDEEALIHGTAPRIAVIGASESATVSILGQIKANVPFQLVKPLASRGLKDVLLIDMVFPGLTAFDARRCVEIALQYEVDMIVLTMALGSAESLYDGDAMTKVGFYNSLAMLDPETKEASAVTRVQPDENREVASPASYADRLLGFYLPGYESGFRHTLAIVFGTADRMPVASYGVLQESVLADESIRQIQLPISDTFLSSPQLQEVRSVMESPLSLTASERLRLLIEPALKADVPVLYVVTPVNQALIEKYPIRAFQNRFKELDDEFTGITGHFEYWPSYEDAWGESITFYDLFHMDNSTAFVQALADRIVRLGEQAQVLNTSSP